MRISDEVSSLLDECTAIRRALHRIPETGFEEYKTSAYVRAELEKCVPDSLESIAGTGLKAVFYAKGAESTIAFRADMDALDETEKTGAPYSSEHEGKMHGCGHDGHMTMLLLVARLIHRHRDRLTENVVLLFQPAEEGKGGAQRAIEEGALKNPDVDRIYGMHVWPELPKGIIGVRWGPMMARTCEFDVTVRGVSAHGASPQMGVDALVSAAAFVTLLQSTLTRNVDPHQDVLLTIGKISGGTARNIIADKVLLNGTIRVMSLEVYNQLMAHLNSMADGLAMATGAKYEITELLHLPCVDNPRHLVEDLYRYADAGDFVIAEPVMAAEDFSCYQERIPGVFMFLGIGGGRNTATLHNSRFDFDEDALLTGVEMYCRLLRIV